LLWVLPRERRSLEPYFPRLCPVCLRDLFWPRREPPVKSRHYCWLVQ
jgi:hypothetical protein